MRHSGLLQCPKGEETGDQGTRGKGAAEGMVTVILAGSVQDTSSVMDLPSGLSINLSRFVHWAITV